MKKRHPASHQPRRDSPGLFEGNVLSEYRWRDGVNGRFAAQRPPASKRSPHKRPAPREAGEGRRLVRTIVRKTQLVEVLIEVDAHLGEREAEDLVRTRLGHDEALLARLDWQPAPAEVIWCAVEDAVEDVATVRLETSPGASTAGPSSPDAPSPEAKASSRGPGKTQQGGSSHECTEDPQAHRKGPLAPRTPRG